MALRGRFWRHNEPSASNASDKKVLIIEKTVRVYGAGALAQLPFTLN
jgi:hypothetical protein